MGGYTTLPILGRTQTQAWKKNVGQLVGRSSGVEKAFNVFSETTP